MPGTPKEAPYRAWPWVLALAALAAPVVNPDLFWHLAAGRWMLAHRALPLKETFSFTQEGAPWMNFEWGTQLLFYGAHLAFGLWGAWLFKAALLLSCGAVISRAVGGEPVRRALFTGLWWTAAVSAADARPELFSLLFFSILLWGLEAWRRGEFHPDRTVLAAVMALFAVWANLHAGFFAGIAVIALYALGEAAERGLRRAADGIAAAGAAALGTAVNPYGLGPWQAAWEHWQARQDLSLYIKEWHAMGFDNPFYLPFWALAALVLAVFLYRLLRWKPIPWGPAFAALYLLGAALAHRRAAVYFSPAAVIFLSAAWDLDARHLRRVALALLSASTAFLLFLSPRVRWTPPFNPKFVPIEAASFISREQPVIGKLRLYNEWEWGGYLSWTIPERQVFADGRYLFHPLLPDIARAVQDPASWRGFMRRRKLDAALVHNLDFTVSTRKRYPDGSLKTFSRPWYTAYLPLEHWALVHWDDKAMLFVARQAVPAPWLKTREYRWHRPKDAAALQEGLKRGEIPRAAWEAEKARHAREAL